MDEHYDCDCVDCVDRRPGRFHVRRAFVVLLVLALALLAMLLLANQASAQSYVVIPAVFQGQSSAAFPPSTSLLLTCQKAADYWKQATYGSVAPTCSSVSPVYQIPRPPDQIVDGQAGSAYCRMDWAAGAASWAGALGYRGDRVMFFASEPRCGSGEEAPAPGSWLLIKGLAVVKDVAHEMGHNYGLAHTNRYLNCGGTVFDNTACYLTTYSNPYGVMGASFAFTTAQELVQLGLGVFRVSTAQTETVHIDPIETRFDAVQVSRGNFAYILEHREPIGLDAGNYTLPGIVLQGNANTATYISTLHAGDVWNDVVHGIKFTVAANLDVTIERADAIPGGAPSPVVTVTPPPAAGPPPVVTANSAQSYLTINGTRTRQVCSDGNSPSIWGLNNAHTINCFASVDPVTVVGQAVFLHVDGSPSGGSSIIETTCYIDISVWRAAHACGGTNPPCPTTPLCPLAHRYQVFDASAAYIGQADATTGPILPPVKPTHWKGPAVWPPVTVTPLPTPIVTASPEPTLTPTLTPSDTPTEAPTSTATAAAATATATPTPRVVPPTPKPIPPVPSIPKHCPGFSLAGMVLTGAGLGGWKRRMLRIQRRAGKP